MDALFKNLCRTLELAVRGAAFGDNSVKEIESQTGIPAGSLHVSMQDAELYERLKKHANAYIFREGLLNNRNLCLVIEYYPEPSPIQAKAITTVYIGHFPKSAGKMYIDFVEEGKVNAHIAML
ncbi:MAG TPA: hypothetical protein HA362_03435 [Nanoarchaeota archaeon]|nr:hypothetical protein [Nanoarchaeota archaeon]